MASPFEQAGKAYFTLGGCIENAFEWEDGVRNRYLHVKVRYTGSYDNQLLYV